MVLQPLLLALKGNHQVKYEKKLMILPVALLSFTTLGIIWPTFCPKTTPDLIFLAGFQWNLLRNSIKIKNFNWNPVVLKNVC